MNGSTLHVRFLGGTAAQQNLVKEQAAWWTAVANIKFEFDNSLNSEIRIAFDPNDGAWSYIGVDCRGIPSNQPTMNLGFLDGGTAAHEFGHALGLGGALHHLVREIVDNSVDEALGGHCDTIVTTIKEDGRVIVVDNGRGIPVDKHAKEGVTGVESQIRHIAFQPST